MVRAVNGLARILAQEGVERVFTFPTTPINNAVGEEGAPELFMLRDERYAVSVADAVSRLSDGESLGVCTVMGGLNAAGVQMAYGALAEAYEDSVPLLCLTDGVPSKWLGVERFDIGEGLRPVAKWVGYVNKAEWVPVFLRRAFTALRSGRPSPVLLQVPRDLGEYDEEAHPYKAVKGWRSMGDPGDVARVVRALGEAERPLLWAGQGVFSAGAVEELKALAEEAHLPVLTTLKAKSVFPEDHELSLGVRGVAAERFLRESDLVLMVGVGQTPSEFMHYIPDPFSKRVVQVTNDPMDLNRMYWVDYAVLGDAKLVLRQLLEAIRGAGPPRRRPGLVEEIRAAKEEMWAQYRPLLESGEKPINPYRVYGGLMEVLDPRNCLVTHESGNTRDQLSTVFTARLPHSFLGWGNVTTLGYGLAGVIAGRLVFPGRQVVGVAGDAGVGYQMGNWEVLVRYRLGVTLVHINNDGFGGYGPGFWGRGHSPYTYEVAPSTVQSSARVAEALGMEAERVEDPDEVEPALRRALKANEGGRPYLLEFICSKYPVYPGWLKE